MDRPTGCAARSVLVTAPAEEPITLAEAKAQLRMTDDDDATDLPNLIAQARDWCEQYCGRAFVTQTRQLVMDTFPTAIQLDMPPAASVTSIQYLDADNTLQTVTSSEYILDLYNEPGWVQPAYGYSWPSTYSEINAVRVQFVCGYGDATAVPPAIKAAIRLLIGSMDAIRENTIVGAPIGEVPLGVKALLAPYRFDLGMA